MIDIDKLAEDIPGIAKMLGELFVTNALHIMRETGISLDGAYPTVAMNFRDKEGNILKFSFGIVEDGEDD